LGNREEIAREREVEGGRRKKKRQRKGQRQRVSCKEADTRRGICKDTQEAY
jgi:hypothetical protein